MINHLPYWMVQGNKIKREKGNDFRKKQDEEPKYPSNEGKWEIIEKEEYRK